MNLFDAFHDELEKIAGKPRFIKNIIAGKRAMPQPFDLAVARRRAAQGDRSYSRAMKADLDRRGSRGLGGAHARSQYDEIRYIEDILRDSLVGKKIKEQIGKGRKKGVALEVTPLGSSVRLRNPANRKSHEFQLGRGLDRTELFRNLPGSRSWTSNTPRELQALPALKGMKLF